MKRFESREQAHKVYDILVELGGALDRKDETYGGYYDRNEFIYAHMKDNYPATEWRFQGHFGFGGKYRIDRNQIDYYPENHTDELNALRDEINKKLQEALEE